MTEQNTNPPAPPSPQPPAGTPAEPAPAATGEKPPPWGKPENFNADQAWDLIQKLRTEKGNPDPQLRSELDSLKAQQKSQAEAVAKAFGVAPEEISSTDKLAETVNDLQAKFAEQQLKATRLEVAAKHQIPAEFHGWLTATDDAALDAQAQQLLPMVQATLAARGQAPLLPAGTPLVPGAPAFAANPGQGQNGIPSPQAAEEAEYQQYASRFNRQRQ